MNGKSARPLLVLYQFVFSLLVQSAVKPKHREKAVAILSYDPTLWFRVIVDEELTSRSSGWWKKYVGPVTHHLAREDETTPLSAH